MPSTINLGGGGEFKPFKFNSESLSLRFNTPITIAPPPGRRLKLISLRASTGPIVNTTLVYGGETLVDSLTLQQASSKLDSFSIGQINGGTGGERVMTGAMLELPALDIDETIELTTTSTATVAAVFTYFYGD